MHRLVQSIFPLHVKVIWGEFEDQTSMKELDPQEEDRLLDEDVNKESQGYSLKMEFLTIA